MRGQVVARDATSNGSRSRARGVAWVALLVAAVLAPVEAAEPQRVVVVGNRVFGTSEVLSLARRGGWKAGGAMDGVHGLSLLQEAYYREGLLGASFAVRSASADSGVVLVIEEGEVARYGQVRVKGAQTRSAGEVADALGMRESAPFVPRLLDARLEELLESYDGAGYPFAQIWLDSLLFEPQGNRVDVVVSVVEGGQKTLANVGVEGLQKTRRELAVRLSGLQPGEPYRADRLQEAYTRLQQSGVFEDVEYPEVRVSADGAGVDAILVVRESKRTNAFAGAVGYATDEGDGEDQVSGVVELKLRNIGGTLKDLGVFWTNDGAGRSETRLRYRDRFFLGRSAAVGASIEQVGLDTLYTWQSVGLNVERPFGRVGVSLGANADRNVFSEGQLERSWRVRASLGVTVARGRLRGERFLQLATKFTLAHKKSYLRGPVSEENVEQYIIEAEGEFRARPLPLVSLVAQAVFRTLESGEESLPLPERFYLGGARTLRGYRENQFNGRRVALLRTELPVGRGREECVYPFVDVGYVLQEVAGADSVVHYDGLVRTGYGFGVRTLSRLGTIDLGFGVGEEFSLRQTKVHVVLERTF